MKNNKVNAGKYDKESGEYSGEYGKLLVSLPMDI